MEPVSQSYVNLGEIGFDEFLNKQPKLSVQHILKRISHNGLEKRMLLTLKICKLELEQDFALFMRELAREAEVFNRQEVASKCIIYSADSDHENVESTDEGTRKHNRKRRSSKSRGKNAGPARGSDRSSCDEKGSSFKGKRDLDLPKCLKPRCSKLHFINNCDMSTAEEKAGFKKKYHDAKRQKQYDERKKDRVRGKVDRIGNRETKNSEKDIERNTSLFSNTFCNGAVEAVVLVDTVSDVTVIPPAPLREIEKADPEDQRVRSFGAS